MDKELWTALSNLGATGLILWWMTFKFIPQLMETFRQEMEKERHIHDTINQRLSDRNDKIMELLVRHFDEKHHKDVGK